MKSRVGLGGFYNLKKELCSGTGIGPGDRTRKSERNSLV